MIIKKLKKPNAILAALLLFSIFNINCCYAVNVGDSYGGGTVFCVSQTPDTTQCVTTAGASGCYGLVMANMDQVNYYSPSQGITWSGGEGSCGASSANDGAANTASIIAVRTGDSSSDNAAWLCHDYVDGTEGHTDWYLPAKNQLNKLYVYANANNLIGIGCSGSETGGGGVQCFMGGKQSGQPYWSSTEYGKYFAYCQTFCDGNTITNTKNNIYLYAVRCIRIFGGGTLAVSVVTKSGYKNTDIKFASIDFTNKFSGACLSKIKIVSLPVHGVLKLSGTMVTTDEEIPLGDIGNLAYTPYTGYLGSDSFGWNGSSDGVQYAANSSSVNITIQKQAPIIISNNVTVGEGQTLTLTTAMLNATSIDGNTVTYSIVNLQRCYFQLTDNVGNHITSFTQQQINSGTVQLVHDGSASAPSFSFTISDGEATSEVQNAVIHFNGINESPYVGVPIPKQQGRVDEEFKYTVPSNTFIDPDGDTLTLSAYLSTGASLPGWLNFDKASASFSGTPVTDGITTIKLVAEDPSKLKAEANFDIEILNTNGGNEDKNWCEKSPATCGGIIAGVTAGVGAITTLGGTVLAWKLQVGCFKPKPRMPGGGEVGL